MKPEPYTIVCGSDSDIHAQVMAYMAGPFAVHRPQYSKSGWKVSYGGLAYPGTFWKRADALAAARLLHSAYTEGWSVQKTEEEARALEETLNVGWRATGTAYPELEWVQRYDDFLDFVWMKGRVDLDWPSWVFSD